MDYTGETFRDCEVRLNGNSFTDCRFERVTFQYAGGPIVLVGNAISQFNIMLDGEIASNLEVLRMFAHAGGPKAVKLVVDGISTMLRRSDPTQTFNIG